MLVRSVVRAETAGKVPCSISRMLLILIVCLAPVTRRGAQWRPVPTGVHHAPHQAGDACLAQMLFARWGHCF